MTETWLDPSVGSEELSIPGYYFIRLDRDRSVCKKRGGGVCVYVKNKYKCSTVTDMSLSAPSIEVLSILLELPVTRKIYLVGVYRPPSAKYNESIEVLSDMLNHIFTTPRCELLMVGRVPTIPGNRE